MTTLNHRQACSWVGPYLFTWSTKAKSHSRRLACNRPAGHTGDHIYYDTKRGQMAKWTRAGAPLVATSAAFKVVAADA